MTLIRCSCIALSALLLNACTAIIPDAQRPDVQQGTLLDRADIARVQLGQTRAQVQELIGKPILGTPFQRQRWDYVYWRTTAGRAIKQRQRLTIVFNQQDRVDRIIDDYTQPSPPTEEQRQPLPDQSPSGGAPAPGPSPGPQPPPTGPVPGP